MKRKFKQYQQNEQPHHYSWNNGTQNRPWHMTLKIQVHAWGMLKWLMWFSLLII